MNVTPLIENLPAVTAVAKPALLAVFNVAPTLMPPIADVLVAVYVPPPNVICAVSSLRTWSRFP